ncbi:MAG TPA: ATP-binding protein [Candidatus Didemnitutus sp.]|nr:ATP-binding protein [Candidatus Didemnitutus sp.]
MKERPVSPRRLAAPFFWSVLLVAALATAWSVRRLYLTARQEIEEQSEHAIQQETHRLRTRIESYTEYVRHSIITDLASFHANGLGASLRQWDEANQIVIGTFRWDAQTGFAADSSPARTAPARDALTALWQDSRAKNLPGRALGSGEAGQTGEFQTRVYRLTDNPGFPEADLGYQAENVELVTRAGHRADPRAGWAASAVPGEPWIFWYQAGPDETVRGCFVDSVPVARVLRSEIVSGGTVNLHLDPVNGASHVPGLPAYELRADPGEVFTRKSSEARLTAIAAASLLGTFLAAAAAVALQSRRRAHEAERKITFVAQVSHELRTPLTSIRMYADLLTAPEVTSDKRTRFAATIATESRRLGDLIERLLAFNALARGPRVVTCTAVDLGALVRAIVEDLTGDLQDAGLQVDLALPGAPVLAWTELSAVKQAIINLLDNAMKYAPGSGTLDVRLAHEPGSVRLRVTDQGPGVPAAIRSRVFEPFVQGGQSVTDKSPGLGLGLSIARGLLRQVGGEMVLLDSTVGAVFEIRLPDSPGQIPPPP